MPDLYNGFELAGPLRNLWSWLFVLLDVMLGRFFGMLGCVHGMAVC